MKQHIDTIPVWEAYKADCECPLCRIRLKNEAMYVDNFLGASVMEPSTRVEVNQKGFCQRHFQMMFDSGNRLGLALMTHTHLQEVIASLQGILSGAPARGGLLASMRGGRAADGPAPKIRARIAGCVICEQLSAAMERYANTIAQLYFTNGELKAMLEQSKGFCLPHLALVLEMAERTLPAKQAQELQKALAALELDNLRRVEHDLEGFTLKFDYRNAGKPWGSSRDAVERSINKLMGACVGEEAQMPPHND